MQTRDELLQELESMRYDRRSSQWRPTLYVFGMNQKSRFLRRDELSSSQCENVLANLVGEVMRANCQQYRLGAGNIACILPDFRMPMAKSFESRFIGHVDRRLREFYERDLVPRVTMGAAVQMVGQASKPWLWRALRCLYQAQASREVSFIGNVDRELRPWDRFCCQCSFLQGPWPRRAPTSFQFHLPHNGN